MTKDDPVVYRGVSGVSDKRSTRLEDKSIEEEAYSPDMNWFDIQRKREKRYTSGEFTINIGNSPSVDEMVCEIRNARYKEMAKSYDSIFTIPKGVHSVINFLAKNLYLQIFPPSMEVSSKEAIKNMEEIVKKVTPEPKRDYSIYNDQKGEFEKIKTTLSLEEQLQTQGDHHIKLDEISKVDPEVQWEAAKEYDLKGIVPKMDEALEDFVYRGNTMLFVHKNVRSNKGKLKVKIGDKDYSVTMNFFRRYGDQLRVKDLKEANKRIPYFMDLTWVTGSVVEPRNMLVPALGLTFTLPQYNGLNFMEMRNEYKSRDKFLEILSHEMVHAGTVTLDNPKRREFLETKAYHVGKGSLMGEFVVASHARPNFLIKSAQFLIQCFFPWVPDYLFKHAPKIKSTVQIATTTNTLKIVKQRLESSYGEEGNYILGRLTADEMDEFRFTDDVKGRVDLKDNLKWRIMKENLPIVKGHFKDRFK